MMLRQALKARDIAAITAADIYTEMHKPPRPEYREIIATHDGSWWSDSYVLAYTAYVPIPLGVPRREGGFLQEEKIIEHVCASLPRARKLQAHHFAVLNVGYAYRPEHVLVVLKKQEIEEGSEGTGDTIYVSWARLGLLWAENCAIMGTSPDEPVYVFNADGTMRGVVMPYRIAGGDWIVSDTGAV